MLYPCSVQGIYLFCKHSVRQTHKRKSRKIKRGDEGSILPKRRARASLKRDKQAPPESAPPKKKNPTWPLFEKRDWLIERLKPDEAPEPGSKLPMRPRERRRRSERGLQVCLFAPREASSDAPLKRERLLDMPLHIALRCVKESFIADYVAIDGSFHRATLLLQALCLKVTALEVSFGQVAQPKKAIFFEWLNHLGFFFFCG